MAANLLLLTSAFLHSWWNFLYKRLTPKDTGLLGIILVATLFSALISPWTGGFQFGGTRAMTMTLLAGVFEAGYFLTLNKSYEKAPLGISYALMRGGAMVTVWLISNLFLGEAMSALRLASLVSLIVGIYLVPSKSKDPISREGILWSLAASVFIAGYHLFYGFALQAGASQVSLFVASMATSMPFLAGQRNFGPAKEVRGLFQRQGKVLLFAGVLSGASFIVFLYGLAQSSAGVAISLRNTSILFTQGFAFFLGERLSPRQWLGVSLIFLGAFGIA